MSGLAAGRWLLRPVAVPDPEVTANLKRRLLGPGRRAQVPSCRPHWCRKHKRASRFVMRDRHAKTAVAALAARSGRGLKLKFAVRFPE